MTDAEVVGTLNELRNPSLMTLGGHVLAFDSAAEVITMSFQATPAFCHSKVIVQGGFITGMVDAAMAHVVLGLRGIRTAVPTLDLRVNFISPGNPGEMIATGRVVHLGKSTAFLAGELHQDGRLVATANATARIYSRD